MCVQHIKQTQQKISETVKMADREENGRKSRLLQTQWEMAKTKENG